VRKPPFSHAGNCGKSQSEFCITEIEVEFWYTVFVDSDVQRVELPSLSALLVKQEADYRIRICEGEGSCESPVPAHGLTPVAALHEQVAEIQLCLTHEGSGGFAVQPFCFIEFTAPF